MNDTADGRTPFEGPFTVVFQDGRSETFDVLAGAAEFLRGRIGRVGESFVRAWSGAEGLRVEPTGAEFLVRDLYGRVLGADDVRAGSAAVPRAPRPWARRRKGSVPGQPGFRAETVPGTGRIGWRKGGTVHRSPGTQPELRATDEKELLEAGVKIRRSRLGLPNAWDDVMRGDYGQRSWKRHRKTQWKD